jgi:hypothetical protein
MPLRDPRKGELVNGAPRTRPIPEFIEAARAVLSPDRPTAPFDENLDHYLTGADALNAIFDEEGMDGLARRIAEDPAYFGPIEDVMPVLCAYRVNMAVEGVVDAAQRIAQTYGVCDACGRSRALQVHATSSRPSESIAADDNLFVVCRECHAQAHRMNEWPEQPWLPPTPTRLRFDFKGCCTKCSRETAGRLHFDPRMQLVDSDGGLLFSNGWTCHNCLGDSWSSSDLAVAL